MEHMVMMLPSPLLSLEIATTYVSYVVASKPGRWGLRLEPFGYRYM